MTRASRSLAGASATALATALALAPSPLLAQAFLGTPTLAGGSATRIVTGPTTETIQVDSPQATLNWVPTDNSGTGDVVFLPGGNTATFTSGSGGQYTILNRIIAADPTRTVVLDGAVNSGAGGAVWFYAPGGLLVGPNANFNVGSLLLTANDPVRDANGFFLSGGAFELKAATGSQAGVTIAPGAQIRALAESSYVLAVAPRVNQGGAIEVNGSAALVAGEEIAFNYNAGLFDITVGKGTEFVGEALRHTGTLTGPASSGLGDFHRIYMVAVPKNDAITMVVQAGGNLGFDIAGKADVVGNAIVLSGGHNIADNGFNDPTATPVAGASNVELRVGRGNYTSGFVGRSADRIEIGDFDPLGTPDIAFAAGVVIRAPESARVTAQRGTVSIAGDLVVGADAEATAADGSSRLAGDVLVSSRGVGSLLSIGGQVTLSARGTGGAGAPGLAGGNGTGGEASLHSTGGGIVQVTGGVEIDVEGSGGVGDPGGGTGLGGLAQVQVFGAGGAIRIGGDLFMNATGNGGDASTVTGTGGAGTGGIVRITGVAGSDIEWGGTLTGLAFAFGGGGGGVSGGTGGQATGGEAVLISQGAIRSLGTLGATELSAFALPGSGDIGGVATGGKVTVQANGGTLSIASDLNLDASASAGSSFAGAGASATGGTAAVEVFGGLGGGITVAGLTELVADASGGFGRNGTGDGGVGTGGTARVSADSGSIALVSGLVATAGASGGEGVNGGAGNAGKVVLSAKAATIDVGADLTLTALADGGNAELGLGGIGGDATAGTITVTALTDATPARLNLKNLQLIASAISGSGGDGAAGQAGGRGGNATGGRLEFFAQAGNGGITTADLTVQLQAFAGSGGIGGDDLSGTGGAGGAGGNATGGFANAGTASGPDTPSLTGYARFAAVSIDASGFGGFGGDGGAGATGGAGGNGGTGTGGNAVLLARGSEVTAGAVLLTAFANGGGGGIGQGAAASGVGGIGQGGAAGLVASPHFVNGGAVNVTLASLTANASGSGGSSGAGPGGAGIGGEASLQLLQNGPIVANTGQVTVTGPVLLEAGATGAAGTAGAGGAATGGTARILTTKGTVTIGDSTTVRAFALGGDTLTGAGTSGAGTGGLTEIVLDGGTLSIAGPVSLESDGTSGFGLPAGIGGSGEGGDANIRIDVNGGTLTLAETSLTATGRGSDGDTQGGAGTGGTIFVASGGGGTLAFTGTLSASATGIGGDAVTSGPAGAAQGGSVFIGASTGRAEFGNSIFADALALGGFATAGTGGAAIGGTVFFDTIGGTAAALADISLDASGLGGASAAGSGGLGRGGLANVTANGTGDSLSVASIAVLEAQGVGGDGDGAGSIGGAGEGGFARATAGRGDVSLGIALTLSASGQGGAGATGGAGKGGEAIAGAFTEGRLAIGGFTLQDASGIGGGALIGFGGDGGAGQGGKAVLSVDGSPVTNRLTGAGATQIASGIGGQGGSGAAGQAGGRGGDGLGGLVLSGSGTNAGEITLGRLTQTALGGGGDGGTGGTGAAGGSGGTGRGGRVGVGNDPNPSALTGNYLWEEADGDATGFGGRGGDGATGGAGGAGFGGVATAGVAGGAMTVTGLLRRNALGIGGAGGTGTTGGTGGSGTGGEAFVGVTPHPTPGGVSTLTAGTTLLNAGGFAGAGGGGTGTAGFVAASARGGTTRLAGLLLEADGAAPTGTSSLGLTVSGLSANGGQLIVTGDADGSFTGDAGLAAGNGGLIRVDGFFELETLGNIVGRIGGTAPPPPGSVEAGIGIVLTAGGSIDVPADIKAPTIEITAQGAVSTGTLTATDLLSVSGSSVATGAVTGGSGVTRLASPNALTVGDVTGPGDIELSAGGALTAGKVDAGRNLLLLAGGPVTTGALRTPTTAAIRIVDGTMASLITTGPSGPDYTALLAAAPVRLAGGITVNGTIDTGSFKAAATGAVALNGAATIAGAATIDAGGLATFTGAFAAPQLTVRATDIEIGATATLGNAGTTQLRLEIDPAATAISVGGDPAAGWSLSGAEAARLRAQNIAIVSTLAGVPVRVGTAALTGSLGASPNLIGSAGLFSIATPGPIRVTGRFAIGSAAATDQLRLSAGRIEVVADAGGALTLANAGGTGGILALDATDIWVGEQALLTQLAADPAFAGRDAALARVPASADLAGALAAGAIQVTTGGSFLVQNSGSIAQRAGFTVGAGGLRVTALDGGTAPVDVVVSGRAQPGSGDLINDRTIEAATLVPASGGRGFAATSSVNGCVFGAACTPTVTPDNPVVEAVEVLTPNIVGVTDQVELVPDADEAPAEKLPTVIVNRLIDAEPMQTAAPIDEPVTSGGNNSLWGGPGGEE